MPSHSLLRSFSWKESQLHLLLLTSLRLDHRHLLTRLQRLSITFGDGVNYLGLGDLANLVGSSCLGLSLLKSCGTSAARLPNSLRLLRRRFALLRLGLSLRLGSLRLWLFRRNIERL